jgi:hypothetical protein
MFRPDPVDEIPKYTKVARGAFWSRHVGAVPPAKLCRELNLCPEQFAQVLVELTNCIGIGTEKR